MFQFCYDKFDFSINLRTEHSIAHPWALYMEWLFFSHNIDMLSNLQYNKHHIQNLKFFLSRLADVFPHSIARMC